MQLGRRGTVGFETPFAELGCVADKSRDVHCGVLLFAGRDVGCEVYIFGSGMHCLMGCLRSKWTSWKSGFYAKGGARRNDAFSFFSFLF